MGVELLGVELFHFLIYQMFAIVQQLVGQLKIDKIQRIVLNKKD